MSDINLSYFQEEVEGELGIRARPKCHKSVTDIVGMIIMNRPQVAIELHASLVAEDEQWQWYDKYVEYLAEYEAVELHNNDLPELRTDINEDGNEVIVYAEPKEFPTLDVRPAIRTGTDLLNSLSYYSDIFKEDRSSKVSAITVTIGDVTLDGDETSQTRLARAAIVLMSQKLVSVEQAIVTASEVENITTAEMLAVLVEAVTMNPTVKWKTADNVTVDINAVQALQFLGAAGVEQSNVWGLDETV